MSDLAKLLGDAYQNLDSFPLDKQKEILDLVEKISETRDKEKARQEFLPFVRAMCGHLLYMGGTMRLWPKRLSEWPGVI